MSGSSAHDEVVWSNIGLVARQRPCVYSTPPRVQREHPSLGVRFVRGGKLSSVVVIDEKVEVGPDISGRY